MAPNRRTLMGAAMGAMLWFAAAPVLAGDPVNKDGDDVAIKGYDTVAYFTDGQPIPGKTDFEHRWQDARWRFASAAHRDLFAQEPEKYAPRYGGFCSGGMALGYKAPVDPEAWVIIDGKLYLNYAKRDVPEFVDNAESEIAKADAHWEQLTGAR
jgi:hypothetical protein